MMFGFTKVSESSSHEKVTCKLKSFTFSTDFPLSLELLEYQCSVSLKKVWALARKPAYVNFFVS